MQNLFTILSAIYILNAIGCTSVTLAEQERIYQNRIEQDRYDKMMGKTAQPCGTTTKMKYEGRDKKPVPDFNSYTPCLGSY